MSLITDWINALIKALLIDGIMGNLGGLFDSVNERVGEIAVEVGRTPGSLELQ